MQNHMVRKSSLVLLSPRGTRYTTGPLAGACVVVTRPAGMSGSLVRRVRALDGSAVRLPGISLRMIADLPRAARFLCDVRDGDWVFSSPAAVHFAFRVAPAMKIPRSSRVFAVGAGTARALTRHGVQAIAPREQADSEGLLALPELADMRGRRVALVGAPGGRDLIASTLRRRGAAVEAVHVYQRVAPRLTRRHFDALAHAPDPLITLLSSAAALTHLTLLLPARLLQRLRHQALVVSSSRLAALARARGFEDIVEAASALPDDLLGAAAKALARHRL